MLDMDEPQLFGAGRGDVTSVHLSHSFYETGHQKVAVWVHTEMRQRPMLLEVLGQADDDMAHVLNRMTPLLQRCNRMSGNLARRTIWAISLQMGREGYDVTIENCGTPKTK